MARPIDADGFLDRNAEFANREFIHPKYQVTLRELVDSEPTLSPDEVRGVGEWILRHNIYTCSECGHTAPYDVAADSIMYWPDLNFCPFCGVKMNAYDNMKGAGDETTD